MIRHIGIRNFAIIENIDIDFHNGLNIITGETGSGKSVVIEAVSLALGSRADSSFVRSGKEKALIQMVFDHDDGNGCCEHVVSREISSSGRSICRIDDEIVTLSSLSAFCSRLADIHGQYDHQSLLNPENHIHLVDLYRKDELISAKNAVAKFYSTYTELKSHLSKLVSARSENQRERDFMEYELREIREAHLREGEDSELDEEIALLQNSEKIYQDLAGAYQIASESDPSLLSAMKRISDMISETAPYSAELGALSERLSGLYYEYEDACASIRDCRDKTVFDPEALDAAIGRADLINRLCVKHGRTIPQLLTYAAELEEKLSFIDNAGTKQAELEKEILDAESALADACAALSAERRKSAGQLEKLISEQLMQLNFNDAEFSIQFGKTEYSAEGSDTVEFMISTNKGEPLKPLGKIASGGEMSRIMLAFKKVIGDYDEIPTMIFDEIDSGISGIAASVVGRKLKEIAANHQIICITHLPQIAAYGTSNYRIAKHSDEHMTYTTVEPLSNHEKISEIARLLGGENITEITLASAKELIAASEIES